MDFITDLPLVDSINSLVVYIDKFSKFLKFCRLTPTFLGEGEFSSKKFAFLFLDSVVRLFGVPSSKLYNRDVHFTA